MAGEQVQGDVQPADATPPQTSMDEAQSELGKLAIMDEESPKSETPDAKADDAKPQETEAADEAAEESDESDTDAEAEDDAEETEAEDTGKAEAKHDSPRVEKRIAKLTAQREEMREKYEAAEARVKDLEQQVVQPIGLHPDYLKPEERTLIAEATALDERRAFLIRHIGRGYDDPKNADKSLTAEQIAEELVQVERSAGRIAKAQALYDERKQQMLDDMRAGRQLRLAKAKLPKPAAPKPVAPATRPGATASKPVAQQVQRSGIDLDRFAKNGGDKEAAIRELAELVP